MIMLINLPKASQCVNSGRGKIRTQSHLLNPKFCLSVDFLRLLSPLPNHTSRGGSGQARVGSPPTACRLPHLAFPEEISYLHWRHLVSSEVAGGLVPLWARFGKLPAAGRAKRSVSPHPPNCLSEPFGAFGRRPDGISPRAFLWDPGGPGIWQGWQPRPGLYASLDGDVGPGCLLRT